MSTWRRLAVLLAGCAAMLVLPVTLSGGPVADAHPLGNFTVNHYDGLSLFPDRIELYAVVDTAEIPTLQDKAATDTDVDGTISPSEADRHGRTECAALAGAVTATVHVAPGMGGITGASAPPTARLSWLDHALASATHKLNELAGGTRLTPLVGTAAALLALLLGASHAALPGHGKTVMAAYLAGRQGTRRDAVLVGVTVTFTHTAGVLVLGLLVAVLSSFAPEGVLRWLGILSGLLVAMVGAGLLRSALRHRWATHPLATVDPAPALAGAPHAHSHGHAYGHGHAHGHGHGRDGEERPLGRVGLVGMGIAGGLVPSPTALFVLLGAIGLGRSWFGIALVLCYGLGMAAALTLAGLLLVTLRDRLARSAVSERWRDRRARVSAALPTMTATLVLVVGLGLALRSLLGSG